VTRMLLALLLLLACCGEEGALIRIVLKLPSDHDPFKGVVLVRVEANGPGMQTLRGEAPVTASEVRLPPIPYGSDRVITVEGLDADNVPIARGQSQPFEVTEDSPEEVEVPFARCDDWVYRDYDGDGFGDPDWAKHACAGSTTSGYVDDNTDCDDGDKEANPDQDQFFAQPTLGKHNFDYNCDGTEEQEFSDAEACTWVPPGCEGAGWSGSVPACGQQGQFVDCLKDSNPKCTQDTPQNKTQACR
jgi:hypothetical protein